MANRVLRHPLPPAGRAGVLLLLGLTASGLAMAGPGSRPAGGERTPVRVVLIGDSTVANYPAPPADRPELTGWGQVFGGFFTERVEVLNRAASGRSSKSFLREGRWEQVLALKPQFVLIQFGHNDQPGKGDRTTDPEGDFRDNLRRCLRDTRAAGGQPLLVTPVARRTFQAGKIHSTLGPYADAMKAVGAEEQTPVLDLHAASQELFGRLGDAGSADFSASATDRTHFSRTGAWEMARLVADAVRRQAPALAAYLTPPGEHHDLAFFREESGRPQPLRSPEQWERRRTALVRHLKRAMGPLPGPEQRVPLAVRIEEETRVGNLIRRRLTYASTSGHRVGAILFLPPLKPGARAPAMLCLHPTGALGKGIVAGLGGRANRQYGLELAQRGFVTLSPDYPSFGDYTCDFRPEQGFQSGSLRAIWDNMRAVDLLETLPAVAPERIGAIGHSLGGHNAIYTGVLEPRLRAIVSSCGFTRFHRYRGGNLKPWAQPCYMPRIETLYQNQPDQVPFDFPELVAALAPRAFFTNSPLRDDNFDVQGVRDCIAAAAPIYTLLGHPERLRAAYPDAGHDFPDETRTTAYQFLETQLGRPD